MKTDNKIRGRKRWLVCGGLLGLSLLLIGAGRMNGEIKSRSAAQEEAKAQCQAAMESMAQSVPLENRRGWEAVAASDPALLIKACNGGLRHVAVK